MRPERLNWMTPPCLPLDRNGPAAIPFDALAADFTERPIGPLFESAGAGDPDRVALVGVESRFTYAETSARVRVLAGRLREMPDAGPVALLLPHGPEAMIAVLACLAAGRVSVLLNASHPAERNALILDDAQARTCVIGRMADRAVLPSSRLPGGATVIAMDDAAESADSGEQAPALGPDAPAFVFYTSGSTGRPKGIVLSQRAVLARSRALIDACHMNPSDRFFPLSHPAAIAGVCFGVASLVTGGRLLLLGINTVGARRALDLIREQRLTILAAFPTLLRMLCQLDGAREAFACLRVLRTGGEKLLATDLAALRDVLPASCHVMPSYASTEGMNVAQWFVPADHVPTGVQIPSGRLLPDHQYAIVDEAGRQVVGPGAGELVLRSRHIALGEWEEGVCVPGRIRPDPDDAARRVLHTGDLVRLGDDGLLRVLGRADRQIKINGQRIEPAEIESALRSIRDVLDAAVLPFADGPVTRLLGFVAARPTIDQTSLRRELGRCLAAAFAHAVRPVRVHILAELPRLPGGKLDHAALLALDSRACGSAADQTCRDQTIAQQSMI